VLPVEVSKQAALELSDAVAWYDEQDEGLGDRLISEFELAIHRIGERPRMFPVVHRDVRRILMRRFPYGVYFRLLHDRTVVVAVFHARRDPTRRLNR